LNDYLSSEKSIGHWDLERVITTKFDDFPKVLAIKAWIVKTLATQILAIDPHLGPIQKRIEEIGKASEMIMRMVSVPGISFLLAARLIGELKAFSRFATESFSQCS